jgi:DNA-binding transcriptional regulator YdaS (Cro superfamily)
MKSHSPIEKLIALFGGPVKCAAKLELKSYQTVQQWRASRVPAEHCPRIEKLTAGKVTCEELRPDVDWAYLRGTVNDLSNSSSSDLTA